MKRPGIHSVQTAGFSLSLKGNPLPSPIRPTAQEKNNIALRHAQAACGASGWRSGWVEAKASSCMKIAGRHETLNKSPELSPAISFSTKLLPVGAFLRSATSPATKPGIFSPWRRYTETRVGGGRKRGPPVTC
jgi:hypothetical protein